MALPVLNTPTYTLEVPSTGESILFRPFLVKEHKILMTLTDADAKEVSRVVSQLISVCTFGKLDLTKLPSFDLEYIFINLRAKSIGELIPITLTCTECDNKIKTEIDLNNVIVEKNDQLNSKIQLRDNVGLTLRYPKFDEIVNLADNLDKTAIFNMVAKCIDTIFTETELYDSKNFTLKEAEEFLLQLTKTEFEQLEQFFVDIPKVKTYVEAICDKCGKVNNSSLQGLQNFFV
tara:strand:- start:1544 stop:2242 length:699 start_codon:yes stop_codon:yes gene_type:complete